MTCSQSCWSLHFLLTNTDAHSDSGHQSFSLLWATLCAISRFKKWTSTYDFDTIVSAMPVLHIVRSCVCVSTLWDVGLTSDQAVTSSLFPSSTILMLKLVMNYFLQSFPFLLIERRTVVSHWQNPTPGPFVSIRWEQLGVISLPSPPINWEIIQIRTQLSNNIVSSYDQENAREVLVYQWSNVRHGIFRSRFQRSISAD